MLRAPGRDLAGPGQFRTAALGRESVIVTRDAGGGVLVPSEHHLAGFHDWVRETVGNRVL